MPPAKWVILDTWAYCKGDHEGGNVESTVREMKRSWEGTPGLQVRVFKRSVRAGSASIPLVCIVARRPAAPVHCGLCAAERGVSIPAVCPHGT